MKNKTSILFALLLALTSSVSFAQFGGLLKDLKTFSDKVQQQQPQQVQQQPQQGQPQQVQQQPQQRQPQQVQQQAQQGQPATDDKGNLRLSLADFKKDWCASIDTETVSLFDYRGVKTGDLCAQPDELIAKIFSNGYRLIDPKIAVIETLSDDELRVRAKEIDIYHGTLIVNPSSKKMYLSTFKAAICASDPSFSLSEGNNFRIALQTKYGKPDDSITAYDALSGRYENLKKQASTNRESAITVAEAKRARDNQSLLDSLSQTMKNPELKKQIVQLGWKFKGAQARSDDLLGLLVWQSNINSLERSICVKFDDQFTVNLFANGGMVRRLEQIVKESQKAEEDRKKNLQAPRL